MVIGQQCFVTYDPSQRRFLRVWEIERSHSSSRCRWYEKLREAIQVRVADGAVMSAIGRGSIRFRCENGTAVTVNEVLHILTLDRRLLAVPKIVQRGHNARFSEKCCGIYKDNVLMISAKRMGSVYTLGVEYEHSMLIEHEDAGSKWELWHARMGHISHSKFKMTQENTEGLPNVVSDTNKNLRGGCLQRKCLSQAFDKSRRQRQRSHCSSFILTSWSLWRLQLLVGLNLYCHSWRISQDTILQIKHLVTLSFSFISQQHAAEPFRVKFRAFESSIWAYPSEPNTRIWETCGFVLKHNPKRVSASWLLFVVLLIKYTAVFIASAHHCFATRL